LPSSPLSRLTSPKPTINISGNNINEGISENSIIKSDNSLSEVSNNDGDQELLQLLSHMKSSPVSRGHERKRSLQYEEVIYIYIEIYIYIYICMYKYTKVMYVNICIFIFMFALQ
jgi:hypothetical protein